MILEIWESKGAQFYFKNNIEISFLYLSKCPLNIPNMITKVRVVFTKKTICNDYLDS